METMRMIDRVGAAVLRLGRTWFVFDANRAALDRVLDELYAELE